MHSVILVTTSEKTEISNMIHDEECMFEKMNGKADYVSILNETKFKQYVEEIFDVSLTFKTVEDCKYFEITAKDLKRFIKKYKAKKLKQLKKIIKNNIPAIQKYLEGGESSSVSMDSYFIKNFSEDTSGVFIYDEFFGYPISPFKAIYDYIEENANDNKSLYIAQAFGYHF